MNYIKNINSKVVLSNLFSKGTIFKGTYGYGKKKRTYYKYQLTLSLSQ